MKRRIVQMEFDNFEDVENFGALYVHDGQGYGAGGWAFHEDVADDIMSDWEHDVRARSFVRVDKTFIVTEVGPDGAPVLGVWHGRAETPHGDQLYFLVDFPFTQTFRVTTDPPPAPRKVDEPSNIQFADFGRKVATLFASSADWNADLLQDVGGIAANIFDVEIDDTMDEGTWLMWEKLAGAYGYEMWEHEGDE